MHRYDLLLLFSLIGISAYAMNEEVDTLLTIPQFEEIIIPEQISDEERDNLERFVQLYENTNQNDWPIDFEIVSATRQSIATAIHHLKKDPNRFFQFAFQHYDYLLLQFLLEKGGDPNTRIHGQPLLFHVTHHRFARLLINYGANTLAETSRETLLHNACRRACECMVLNTLLAHPHQEEIPEVNNTRHFMRRTPLHTLIGSLAPHDSFPSDLTFIHARLKLNRLIAAGADVTKKAPCDGTPLQMLEHCIARCATKKQKAQYTQFKNIIMQACEPLNSSSDVERETPYHEGCNWCKDDVDDPDGIIHMTFQCTFCNRVYEKHVR